MDRTKRLDRGVSFPDFVKPRSPSMRTTIVTIENEFTCIRRFSLAVVPNGNHEIFRLADATLASKPLLLTIYHYISVHLDGLLCFELRYHATRYSSTRKVRAIAASVFQGDN